MNCRELHEMFGMIRIVWTCMNERNGMEYELHECYQKIYEIHETWIVCLVCVWLCEHGLIHWASSHTITVLEFVYRFHRITQNTGSPADLVKSLLLHTKIIANEYAYVYWLCIDAYIYYWGFEMLIWSNV